MKKNAYDFRGLKAFIAVFSIWLVSGCVSVLPDPVPAGAIYRLETHFDPAPKASDPIIVRVDRPAATRIFNNRSIVVTLDDQKLSNVSQAQWSESPPVLIQNALVDALSASSQFIGLIPTSGARTDMRVHLAIKRFEASFADDPDGAPLAIVQYRVTYSRADNRKLLGSIDVRQTQLASGKDVPAVVDAISTANQAAMDEIVAWLATRPEA